jgi:prephenate dehydrogenase
VRKRQILRGHVTRYRSDEGERRSARDEDEDEREDEDEDEDEVVVMAVVVAADTSACVLALTPTLIRLTPSCDLSSCGRSSIVFLIFSTYR